MKTIAIFKLSLCMLRADAYKQGITIFSTCTNLAYKRRQWMISNLYEVNQHTISTHHIDIFHSSYLPAQAVIHQCQQRYSCWDITSLFIGMCLFSYSPYLNTFNYLFLYFQTGLNFLSLSDWRRPCWPTRGSAWWTRSSEGCESSRCTDGSSPLPTSWTPYGGTHCVPHILYNLSHVTYLINLQKCLVEIRKYYPIV